MPKITNRVLTAPNQGLDDTRKTNARANIDAMKKNSGQENNIVIIGKNGEAKDSGRTISTYIPDVPDDKQYVLAADNGASKWSKMTFVDDPVP